MSEEIGGDSDWPWSNAFCEEDGGSDHNISNGMCDSSNNEFSGLHNK